MIKKEEYSALYYINYGNNSIERLQGLFDNKKEVVIKLLKSLEEKKLIKIEMRQNEIYSFMETDKGLDLLKSKEYAEWYIELGD